MRKIAGFLVAIVIVPALVPAAALRDRYGGWGGLRFEKRGWFYVAQRNGTWWFVTPEGAAFFSKGVNHVSYTGDRAPALGYAPFGRVTARKYGSRENWARTAAERLRKWGFNTIGAWSDAAVLKQGIPYTVNLNLGARAGARWLTGEMPDFFSQKFRKTVEDYCRRKCSRFRNDPFLLGYFTDNELSWTSDWRSKKSLLERYLALPAGSDGRRAAESFLKKRHRAPDKITRKDKDDFLETVARRYFSVCRDAIRAADPNHVVLGCRFAGHAPEPVLRAMKDYVEVVSLNQYSPNAPVEKIKRIHRITGKPVLITEFSFKARDSGLPNTKGAGRPVATQKDRADGFERYVRGLAETPCCVGFHWFRYCDEPKEGRFDGENSNYGLVDIKDEPWRVLVERIAAVNPRLDEIHARSGK